MRSANEEASAAEMPLNKGNTFWDARSLVLF
jgi:hypothetical protein